MSKGDRCGPSDGVLAVRLDFSTLSVSYLSSLLRVLQAAIREVARSVEDGRDRFDQLPQPVLVICQLEGGDDLILHLVFMDADGGGLHTELSSTVFGAFMDELGEFIRGLPQPGLWGRPALRPPEPDALELSKRMDQVYRELHRSSKSAISFRGHTIEIEGDRLEML